MAPHGAERHAGLVIESWTLTPGDWAVWRELRLAALRDAPEAFSARLSDWQGGGDREERWRARLDIPGSVNLVAVLDGRPAGMASGVPAGPQTAELISLWVSPAARRRGVGEHLVGEVARWARRSGAGVLRLALAEGNGRAAALYRRCGFRPTGETALAPAGVGAERLMAKDLSARGPSEGAADA